MAAVHFQRQAEQLGKALTRVQKSELEATKNRAQAERDRDRANESRQRTERALGSSRLDQSVTAWHAGNVFLARSLCEDVPPDVRAWEWRYLRRQYTGGLFTTGDRLHGADCLAYHPQGKFLASGGKDGTVRCWDAVDGHALSVLKGHAGVVRAVAFSPRGDRLASGGLDRKILIRSTESGEILHALQGHAAEVLAVAWSPDGGQLASAAADRTLRLWDTATGELVRVLAGHRNAVGGVAFSPDGRLLASASDDGTARLWDAHSGASGRTFDTDGRAPRAVCFSPDGRTLAAGGKFQLIRLWDVGTGAEVRTLDQVTYKGPEMAPVGYQVTGLCYSPDGRQLASCRGAFGATKPGAVEPDTAIRIWDPDSGQRLFTCAAHSGSVRALSYSPDGRRLASVTWDTGEIKAWDVRNAPEYRAGPYHSRAVLALCHSPDGKRLATASGDQRYPTNPEGVIVSDAATGRVERLLPHPTAVGAVAFHPDGAHLVTACRDGKLRVWEVATGKEERVLTGHKGTVPSVCYSADGGQIASAGLDSTVRVWDAKSGLQLRVYERPGPVHSVCFGAGGDLAAGGQGAAGRGGDLLLWRPGDDTPQVLGGHTRVVTSVCFSPDGSRLASAGWDRTVRIRDLAGGGGLLLRGHTTIVTGVAFSPDGRRLASCDLDAGVRVWDAASGQEVLKLAGPEPQTRAVGFSPDGRRMAAVGGASDPASPHQPGEVRVWDAGRPQPGVTLTGLTSPVEAVWFGKDGDRLLARATAGRTLAWSLPQARPLGEVEETPPPTAGRLAESPGQRFRATGLGDHAVFLVDLGDTDADRAELRALAAPDPGWHVYCVRRCSSKGPASSWPHPIAAAFHARQALLTMPNDAFLLRTLREAEGWLGGAPGGQR